LSRQAKSVEEAIEDEHGANQVAALLQQTEAEKEEQDVRQKHHHTTDASNDTVHHQGTRETFSSSGPPG
jgi:hypothetical protein